MATTANSKKPRISIPGLHSKWFFGSIRIYNAEKNPSPVRKITMIQAKEPRPHSGYWEVMEAAGP